MIEIHHSVKKELLSHIPFDTIVETTQNFFQTVDYNNLKEIILNSPTENIDESWTFVSIKNKKTYLRSNNKDLDNIVIDYSKDFFPYSSSDQEYGQFWIDRTDGTNRSIPHGIKKIFKPLVEYFKTLPGYLECTNLHFSKNASIAPHIHGDEKFPNFNLVIKLSASKEGSMIRILDEVIDLSSYDGFLFNGTLDHEAWNAGEDPWYMLVLAFCNEIYD